MTSGPLVPPVVFGTESQVLGEWIVTGDFLVGDAVVRPQLNLIEKDGKEVRLEPKAISVLQFLAEQAGEVVSKHELIDAVWEVKTK